MERTPSYLSEVSRLHRFGRSIAGRRRALWFAFLAVLLPLVIWLGVQYRWLVNLEKATQVAEQATLQKYLEFIDKQVTFHYSKKTQLAYSLPVPLFKASEEELLAYFRETVPQDSLEGIRLVFVTSFLGEYPWTPFFYDPKSRSAVEGAPISAYLAILYWEKMALKGQTTPVREPIVDERDIANPIILQVATDPETSKLAGVAGVLVDVHYFERTFLPQVIRQALPQMSDRQDLEVSVRNADGQEVFNSGPAMAFPGGEAQLRTKSAERRISFVLKGWTLALRSTATMGARWARGNFIFNMTLSVILAGTLMGGILLALRTASREMRLSQMKNDFVSNVSHELRTPLSSIRAFGELLRLGRVTGEDKIREYGEFIEVESRRLTQLINNILDFSRIESGRKCYRFVPSDLNQVVEQVLGSHAIRLKQSGFQIDFRPLPEAAPKVPLDAEAIALALSNLLDNAVKYSNGNRRIRVDLKSRQEGLDLSVQDWGVGIPREEQQRIFDRFHRVSTGLVHDVKGAGLGLAIVRHIAQAHGGSVFVVSEPNQGSTFTIRFPVNPQIQAESPQPDTHPKGGQ